MTNYTEYKKAIPKFYQQLLDQISKVQLFSTIKFVPPHEQIHYQPTKDGIKLHMSELIKLSHELAHLIEVKDNRRLVLPDYGMPTYFPKTTKGQLQAIAREARVRGIQTRLIEIAFGRYHLLVHQLSHTYLQPFAANHKFGTTQAVVDWSTSIMERAYQDWTQDKILHDWSHKAEFINHWLEISK